MNKTAYNDILEAELNNNLQEQDDIDQQIKIVTDALIDAQKKTTPNKITQLRGPKWKASPPVQELLKKCKILYTSWSKIGKPKNHNLHKQLKAEKRNLRRQQLMEHDIDRTNLYQRIMENPNTQPFCKLIDRNRQSCTSATNCIRVNDKYMFSIDEQRIAFAKYYEDLSIPKEELFDNSYVNLCNIRQSLLEEELVHYATEPFTEEEVQNSIDKLNTNKSSDEYGINAEHLKNSKKSISSFLTKTFNKILEIRKAPTSFKTGVLTPVLKKGKDTTLCASYRGITVTSIIGKTFEYSMLRKLKLTNMTDLQFGFTEGLNPIMASLLISESKCEKKKNSKGIIDQSIHPTLWLIIKDLYSGLTSKVKWADDLSESFDILQGVRQGGFLSTHLYKIFVQDLLLELESKCLGFQLGDIYIGTPTCADDIALIESNKDNL